MPPQSRGTGLSAGLHSKSTPNLPTLGALDPDLSLAPNPLSPTEPGTSPSEVASVEDNLSPEDDLDLHFDRYHDAAVVDDDNDDEHSRQSLYAHSSRSHSALPHISSALFPPFYNRPPTPMPPSPSLTSLLRPSSFSAQASRPTTPDSSDVEGMAPSGRGGGSGSNSRSRPSTTAATTTTAAATAAATGASPGLMSASGAATPTTTASSSASMATAFAAATLVPRASPKVPTYEYYGFFIYLASSLAFLMYLLWAYLPRPFLHQLGIYYYPNRWWALAVPAWLVALVIYIYVALASYNLGHLTLPMPSSENLVDDAAQIATLDAQGRIVRLGKKVAAATAAPGEKTSGTRKRTARPASVKRAAPYAVNLTASVEWRAMWSESTDAVLDVPVGGVCEILYGHGRRTDDEHDSTLL